MDRGARGRDLDVESPAIARLPDTVAAYSIVMQNAADIGTIEACGQVPAILDQGERIVALACAKVKKRGPAVLALTNSRLIVANTQGLSDNFSIDPAEWDLESAGHGFLWGNNAKLRRGDDVLVLRSFGPTSEATRILSAFGFPIPEDSRRALPEGFPRDPGSPPIAGLWELSIYRDRMIDEEGNHLPFHGQVEAVADAAGNIAVTRGRNLAAKGLGTLALGPIGLFFIGNAKERQTDTRELYLLVEGPNWAYTHAFPPDLGELLRRFAQQINVAAREHVAGNEPVAAQPPSTGAATDLAGQLRELASLRDEGLLTSEEFEDQKRKLLDG